MRICLLDMKKVSVVRIKGVRIKRVEFKENVRAFLPQGQSKLSVTIRRPYKASVRIEGFDCNS